VSSIKQEEKTETAEAVGCRSKAGGDRGREPGNQKSGRNSNRAATEDSCSQEATKTQKWRNYRRWQKQADDEDVHSSVMESAADVSM
jgi:hypothetical protein